MMDPLPIILIGIIGFISIIWQVILIKNDRKYEKIEKTERELRWKKNYRPVIGGNEPISERNPFTGQWEKSIFKRTPAICGAPEGLNAEEEKLFNKCCEILANRKIWQEYPKRIVTSVSFGLIVIIGTTLYHSYPLIAPSYETFETFEFGYAFKMMALSVFFSLIFVLKSYFSPLVLGYFTGYSVYMYFLEGTFIIPPIVRWILELIFTQVPSWLQIGYTIGFVLFSLISGGLDFDKIDIFNID